MWCRIGGRNAEAWGVVGGWWRGCRESQVEQISGSCCSSQQEEREASGEGKKDKPWRWGRRRSAGRTGGTGELYKEEEEERVSVDWGVAFSVGFGFKSKRREEEREREEKGKKEEEK